MGKRLDTKAESLYRVFRAVGHMERARIVLLLLKAPSEIRFLAKDLDLSESLLVHHLHILREGGWIDRKKQGKVVTYSIKKDALRNLIAQFRGTELDPEAAH